MSAFGAKQELGCQQAQRLYEGLHGGRQVGSLKYLDVFPATSSTTLTTTLTATTFTPATLARVPGSRDRESASSPG